MQHQDLADAIIVPNLPWIIGGGMLLGLVAILGWVFTTWLRVRHGYPLETSWGTPLEPGIGKEAAERIKLLTGENAQLRAELGSVKDRLENIERIVTDRPSRLAKEIDALAIDKGGNAWHTATAVRSSPSGCTPVAAALIDAGTVADQAIKTARTGIGAELAGLADYRLPGPQHQPSIVGESAREPLKRQSLFLRAQIQEDVAAQDDVEITRMRERLEEIVHLEANRLAQGFDRSPAVGRLFKPFDHLVDAKAALNLELAVHPATRAIDAARRDVAAEDIDGPATPFLRLLGE